MIILPDKNIVRTKFLISVPEFEWRDPSQAQQKDQLGNSVFRTSFRIRARLNDGFVKWTGWFDSRNDYDAFLWAIVTGTLKYERELWKLPTPQWHPDIGTDLSYDFATQRLITSTSASNQTDTVPSDWNSNNNTIETIGCGGSAATRASAGGCTGGGGGAYSLVSNIALTKGASVTFFLATGPAGVSTAGTGFNGTAGSNVWYNGTTVSNASVSSFPGQGGQIGLFSSTGASAAGGTTGGVGTTKYAGGASGTATSPGGTSYAASGGGGAAGPSGIGGTSSNASSSSTSAGGTGNNGTTAGGAAGGTTGSVGNSGTEFTTAGCGSGGGGGVGTNAIGGNGGNYGGGGGGGCGSGTTTSGSGIQGIIVATYSTPPAGFNMPMLGM